MIKTDEVSKPSICKGHRKSRYQQKAIYSSQPDLMSKGMAKI
jgi:hypothetical protein